MYFSKEYVLHALFFLKTEKWWGRRRKRNIVMPSNLSAINLYVKVTCELMKTFQEYWKILNQPNEQNNPPFVRAPGLRELFAHCGLKVGACPPSDLRSFPGPLASLSRLIFPRSHLPCPSALMAPDVTDVTQRVSHGFHSYSPLVRPGHHILQWSHFHIRFLSSVPFHCLSLPGPGGTLDFSGLNGQMNPDGLAPLSGGEPVVS